MNVLRVSPVVQLMTVAALAVGAWFAVAGPAFYLLLLAGAALVLWRRQLDRVDGQAEYSHRLEREVARRTDELEAHNRELAALNQQLQEVSVTDSLTGLWNRRYLANEIPKELALLHRTRIVNDRRPVAERGPDPNLLFFMIDVDGLKRVNDTYGHQAGDRAIVQMKETILGVCRQTDTLIRWGGDEFLLLGRQNSRDAAPVLAERIKQAVEVHRFDLGDGDTARLTCSVGFAVFPFMPSEPTLITWEQVLDLADRALYCAKQGGRNRWVGVLSVAGSDRALVVQRRGDDLEQLARDGVVQLRTAVDGPSSPADAGSDPRATPRPWLVRATG